MQIGNILRYSKKFHLRKDSIDGYPNFWHVTHMRGVKKLQLEKGINTPQKLKAPSQHYVTPSAGPDIGR